jgi:hypothetical protein
VAVALGSGVNVSVGMNGVGVKTAAVNVNCDTTVLAAEVRTAATSGVGSGVVADPQAARSRLKTSKSARYFGFMETPSCSKLWTLFFYFEVNGQNRSEPDAAIILHTEVRLIFTRGTWRIHPNTDINTLTCVYEVTATVESKPIRTIPGTASELNKGIAIIPEAGACISDRPYFLEIFTSLYHGSIRNSNIAFKDAVMARITLYGCCRGLRCR